MALTVFSLENAHFRDALYSLPQLTLNGVFHSAAPPSLQVILLLSFPLHDRVGMV